MYLKQLFFAIATCLLATVAVPDDIYAQDKPEKQAPADTLASSYPPGTPAAGDTATFQFQQYESDKSFGQHLLSTPAYIVHGVSRPIGGIIQFAERVFPRIFPIEIKNFTISPWVEIGGQNPITFSASAFNNNFLQTENRFEVEFSVSSAETNQLKMAYKIGDVFSSGDLLTFSTENQRDESRKFFSGNSLPLDLERFHDEEIAGFKTAYKKDLTDVITINTDVGFRSSEIGQGSFNRQDPAPGDFLGRNFTEFRVSDGDTLLLFPNALKGTTRLFNFNGGIQFDFTEPAPRQFNESRIMVDAGISRSLNSDDFGFYHYRFEFNQFVPIFFKPKTRRLALRAVLEQVRPLGGKEIPFFRQPELGSQDDMRGFTNNRFRNDGALYYTAEYRYLIGEGIDGLLFVDQGQVFGDFKDIALNDFHTDFGFGFHLLSSKGIAVRWEFAFSEENNRTVLSFGKNF